MLTIEKDGLEYVYPLEDTLFAYFLVVLTAFPLLLVFCLVLWMFASIVHAVVIFVSGVAILSLVLAEICFRL